LAHAEVVDGRAEEHRRLRALPESLGIERRRGAADQLDLLARLVEGRAETLLRLRVVQAGEQLVATVVVTGAVRTGPEHPHAITGEVEHAAEALAHADRPGERDGGHAEHRLDLVKDDQRL